MTAPKIKQSYRSYSRKDVLAVTGLTEAEYIDMTRVRANKKKGHDSSPYFGSDGLFCNPGTGNSIMMVFSDLMVLKILKLMKAHRMDRSLGRRIRGIFGITFWPGTDNPWLETFVERKGEEKIIWLLRTYLHSDGFQFVSVVKRLESGKEEVGDIGLLRMDPDGLKSTKGTEAEKYIQAFKNGEYAASIEFNLNRLNQTLKKRISEHFEEANQN